MIEINKYNRNDVFIEEINNSQIEQQPAQESIINFVPGFSKKGKFNAPALIRTKADRESIYGSIDRSLETKDSWFHRTIDVALASGPVSGLSLLKTSDDDVLNYASISLAPQTGNGVVDTAKYSSFFNKAGFWYRDTESFINTVDDADRIFHLTNMSDKKISVFMFKSPISGYDVTLETWYGSKDKVPTYLYSTDLVSDYLVRVVVLAGDWSNYKVLANDSIWGKYFNADGLNKATVDTFLNEKTVNTLGKYDVSLIPYFRDRAGKNIFIESIVNQFTDITGLFCAFNIDRFESDLPNGLVDLIGHTLIYSENKLTNPSVKDSIDFLSYKDTIIETEAYTKSTIDRLGNVVSLGVASIAAGSGEGARTGFNSPGYVSGVIVNSTAIDSNTTLTATVTYTSTSGYGILYGAVQNITTYSAALSGMSAGASSTAFNYYKTVYALTSTGIVRYVSEVYVGDPGSVVVANITFTFNASSWANGDIILGYVITVAGNVSTTNTYYPIAVNGSGYNKAIGSSGSSITTSSSNTSNGSTITLTFTTIASPTKLNIEDWRGKQLFDAFLALKGDSRSVIVFNGGVKIPISAFTWTDSSLLTSSNKYITLTLNTTAYGSLTLVTTNSTLHIYGIDDEFIVGTTNIAEAVSATATIGIAAKYSKFYLDFYNGLINTGNYFYVRVKTAVPVRFVDHTDGYSYIIIPTANVDSNFISGYKMWIPDHSVNSGVFTLTANGSTSVSGLSLSSETAYKVSETVTTASAETVDIYSYGDKVYLRIYTLNDVLVCNFYADSAFTGGYTIDSGYVSLNSDIKVYSDSSTYEQTLEIETIVADNKILVNSSRYAEVVLGDYLEAYIDYSLLEAGEVPKSFTRIISKRKYSDTLVEITTDAKISVKTYGSDLQTRRYTNVEDYVSTYKAITLGGFAVRPASLPDGTETRQSLLLDLFAKETPLFDAITNKNKFSFRYLIDSLGNGLTEFSKQQLVDICGKRKSCIGFLNMPSIKKFKKSSSPSFTDNDGNLIVNYIKTGGNIESSPAFLYSFGQSSGDIDGTTSVGYFLPYVQVNENGRPLLMPPAAFVANTYMAKNNSSIAGKYPYTIAAGVEDGRINGIADVEYDFTEKDLEALFEMKANPIVYTRNNVFSIDNEFTAQANVQSSLSYLHAREVLIEIENELYNLLLPYKHKFNTTGIRTQIKRRADNLLQKYKDRNAIYDFFNIIDETNNTEEIIDNAMGLLQTYIEIVKGMGIIVGVISVEKTGAISASGFSPTGQTTI